MSIQYGPVKIKSKEIDPITYEEKTFLIFGIILHRARLFKKNELKHFVYFNKAIDKQYSKYGMYCLFAISKHVD